jgi:predicted ribosome quality control (RQC) complex YloA/Tae2 family protein
MGYASYLEDILEKRDQMLRDLEDFSKSVAGRLPTDDLRKFRVIEQSICAALKGFDPVIEFLTDPDHSDKVNLFMANEEIRDLQKELKHTLDKLKKMTAMHEAMIRRAQEEDNRNKQKIAELKTKLKSVRKTNESLCRKLDNIYTNYPNIAYDTHPPKNPNKQD